MMRSTPRRRVWWIFSLARPFSCCFLFTHALFSLFFPNETDQTSTRKRRIFRHAILRLDARAVHGASRSDGAVRRHAQSRITVRPVVPFALSGLDSRENAFGAVSCGRRGKRGSGENRWEYRNRRTIILKPPSVCSSRPLYIFCGPFLDAIFFTKTTRKLPISSSSCFFFDALCVVVLSSLLSSSSSLLFCFSRRRRRRRRLFDASSRKKRSNWKTDFSSRCHLLFRKISKATCTSIARAETMTRKNDGAKT